MNDPSFPVSVVIPAKNRARTLPYCLDSVLAQTLPPAEVIVVDDSSSDDTAEVVRAYAQRGVVYQRLTQGRGAQAARNEGVRVARSPWIAFQDSDDTWLPRKLELQLAALRAAGSEPLTVVHGDGLRRDEQRGVTAPYPVPSTEGQCHALLLKRPGPLFPTLLVSKDALARAGGLDDACPSYQEWDTAIRLARHCTFVHVHEPLFVWIWHASDTISKDLKRDVTGYNYVLDVHRSEIVRAHGARFWRAQKLGQAVRAMRVGLWDTALAHLEGCEPHHSINMARFLARVRFVPPGAGRLLRLSA